MQNILKENPFEPIPVVALTLDGQFVGRYDNITDAAFKLSLSDASIHHCVVGRQIRAGKYIFIKADKYNPDVKITYASLKRKRNFLKSKAA